MFIVMCLYLLMMIIRPQDFLPILADVPIMPVLIILALASWVLSSRKDLNAPQYLLLTLFGLVTAASILAAGWVGGAWQQVLDFAPILVAFVVLANALDSERRIRIVMMLLVLCGAVLVWHGIYQLSHGGVGWTGASLSKDQRIQYVGIFHDPNDLGLLFVMVLPMSVYLLGRHGAKFFGRIFWLACACLLVYGIYLTKSRGAMLALAAILGIYVWRKRGAILALILGGGALGLLQMISPRMNELNPDESSAFGRVDAWYEGLHLFVSHPFLGVGTNNFTEYNNLTAHNSFVLVLAETGFVGYVLWLAFVCYGLWMALSVVRFKPDADWLASDEQAPVRWQQAHALGMTMLLAQVGFMAAAFFLSRSYVPILYLLEAIVLASYVFLRTQIPGLPQFQLRRDLIRWPSLAVASIVALYVLVKLLYGIA